MVLVKRSVGFKRKYLLQHYFGAPALETCWWPATPVVMYIQYVSTSQLSQSVQALLNIGLGSFEHYASHWLGQNCSVGQAGNNWCCLMAAGTLC